MKFFDSHSHYNDEKFEEDREEILEKVKNAGAEKIVIAGYDIESSKKAIEIAKKSPNYFTICGISPNDVPEKEELVEEWVKEIESLIEYPKVVAIGEIGLDYYWNTENKEIQKKMFCRQIELANRYNLPIVIHTREAVMDTLEILKKNTVNKKGIFHCCPLNRELVKEGLKLGFSISFAGPVTFKNSKNAVEIIEMVPMDRMVIETDCPYLAPEPVRGTRNDSSNLQYIVKKIAEVKGITEEEVAKITYQNAEKIFER